MPGLNDIPPELILEVISTLPSHHLCAFRLVSRRFALLARPFLYRRLGNPTPLGTIQAHKFLRILEQHPEYASYVETAALTLDTPSDADELAEDRKQATDDVPQTKGFDGRRLLLLLLSKLHHLQELQVAAHHFDGQPDPQRWLPALQRLSWIGQHSLTQPEHDDGDDINNLLPIITATPKLQGVVVRKCYGTIKSRVLPNWECGITSLELHDTGVSTEYFPWLFEATKSLAVFRYKYTPPPSGTAFVPSELKEALLKVRRTLEVLEVGVTTYHPRHPGDERKVVPLTEFPRLRSVNIDLDLLFDWGDERLVGMLPEGLTHLAIEITLWDFHDPSSMWGHGRFCRAAAGWIGKAQSLVELEIRNRTPDAPLQIEVLSHACEWFGVGMKLDGQVSVAGRRA